MGLDSGKGYRFGLTPGKLGGRKARFVSGFGANRGNGEQEGEKKRSSGE